MEHKERYDQLVQEKEVLETKLREISDKLKVKRHEKVKVKGLSDY